MRITNIVQNLLTGMAQTGAAADRAEARQLLAKLNAPETEYAAPKRAKKGARRGCR